MKRNTKGHFGYIRRRKRNLSIMVGILAAGIIGLVLLGYLTLGTKNNWLTIVAILTVLPTANLAVVLFALLPYKGRPKEEYDQVVSIVGDSVLDTELIITSKTDKNMEIDYAYFHEEGVFCYTIRISENHAEKQRRLIRREGLHRLETILKTPALPGTVFQENLR